MANRLNGKTAVVTGIASGIARETALVFAREGATVVGNDINVDGAKETVELAAAQGHTIELIAPVDMFDLTANRDFVGAAAELAGGIDILVNSAAITRVGLIEDMTADDFNETVVAELHSVFWASQAAWPHLKKGGGSIINIASTNSHQAVKVVQGIAHTAGKGGVLAMTRQMAMEGGPHGIRANTVSPGFIVTGSTKPVLDAAPEARMFFEDSAMLGRMGTPADIANGILYLASDESGYVTGADLRIDGGMTSW